MGSGFSFLFAAFLFSVAHVDVASAQSPVFPFQSIRNQDTWMLLQSADAGDFNNDGAPDFYVRGPFMMDLMISLSRDGNLKASRSFFGLLSPSYPASAIPGITGMAHGDMDGDRREDLVTITDSGAVMLYPNSGSYQTGRNAFSAGIVVDFFGPGSAVNPPFLIFSNPILKVVDLDRDGNLDIVTASGFIDIWNARTMPGQLYVYFNQGSGTFYKTTLPLSGNIIDIEVVDLNVDGILDHLVFVTETSGFGVGSFGYDLHHVSWNVGPYGINFSQPPQAMMGRVTALEIADVFGTPDPDYLLSSVTYSAHAPTGQITAYEGNGLGGLNLNLPYSISLPPNNSGLGDSIFSFRAADINRDGHADLVLLRNYTQGVPFGSNASPMFADAEIFVAMGPNAIQTIWTVAPLGGYILDPISPQTNAAILPLFSVPDALRWIDLDRDPSPDFSVGPVVVNVGSQIRNDFWVFKNTTPRGPTDGGFETIGGPSGGNPQQPPWLGFDVGTPVVGNGSFGIRASDLPPGAIVSFVWSSFGLPNLYSSAGIDIHLVPMVYSNLYTANTAGAARCPIPIPNAPGIVGDVGFFQCGTFDPGTGRFGGTEAVHVNVGR